MCRPLTPAKEIAGQPEAIRRSLTESVTFLHASIIEDVTYMIFHSWYKLYDQMISIIHTDKLVQGLYETNKLLV